MSESTLDRIDALLLKRALRDLVTRCDGPEGVRADGSNIDTIKAHFVLGDFDDDEDKNVCPTCHGKGRSAKTSTGETIYYCGCDTLETALTG
jgi:hypothetical protein